MDFQELVQASQVAQQQFLQETFECPLCRVQMLGVHHFLDVRGSESFAGFYSIYRCEWCTFSTLIERILNRTDYREENRNVQHRLGPNDKYVALSAAEMRHRFFSLQGA